MFLRRNTRTGAAAPSEAGARKPSSRLWSTTAAVLVVSAGLAALLTLAELGSGSDAQETRGGPGPQPGSAEIAEAGERGGGETGGGETGAGETGAGETEQPRSITERIAEERALNEARRRRQLAEATPPADAETGARDPRSGDEAFERSRRLFAALRDILDEAARRRLEQQVAPEGALSNFFYRQFGVDQNSRIRSLLDSAFEMMTDAPVTQMQRRIAEARDRIDQMRERIAELREERIAAPEDGGVSSLLGLAEDQGTLTDAIEDLERRIAENEAVIEAQKRIFAEAMAEAGAPLSQEQVDLLLDSVTGEDLTALAAAYEAVRGVSGQLRRLMDESGEDLVYAKRYYGMHTALIALLVEAHTQFLRQVDETYLPRLAAIERDLQAAAAETQRLLGLEETTEAQRRVLQSNAASQRVALEALEIYRDYLTRQRAQIDEARARAVLELRVADNTLRTVDASYQLRQIMENAATSFEALQSLESPGFERLFRNEQLRREFQALTERLAPGS